MRETLRTAPKPHALTNVVSTFFASLADLARQTNFQCYLISNTEVFDVRANTDHNTSRLVAKRERLLNKNVAIAIVSVVVKIRTAEAGGANADLKVCWARWKD